MTAVLPIGLPPQEAIAYFRHKGYELGFNWQDIYTAQHGRVFTVAKVMRADLLETIRVAVDGAIANGTTLEEFGRDLTPLLQREGWWGAQRMVDPTDGGEKIVQLGSPRRLETIFDTNLRSAQAAGKWEQIQRTKARRPYLRYIHLDSANPRPQHLAWNNLVLPADDPFWQTHYPPNGWKCHCSVQQLADRDLGRYGVSVGQAPPIETVTYRNPRTGEVREVPKGIDPGFDVNVGAIGADHYRQLLVDRAAAAPADLREALLS